MAGLVHPAWDNASQAILERSLDDSANRRLFQPEAFLTVDEMLVRALPLVRDMVIDEEAIRRNLGVYGPFAATERVLMALVAAGASRQDGHEWLREQSLRAWQAVREGAAANPLHLYLSQDPRLLAFLSSDHILALMHAEDHVGTAPARALALAEAIRQALG